MQQPSPPSTTSSTGITRFNAVRHGILSRHTVLPWEDLAQYDALLSDLVAEYVPASPTEEHLVEEIAGVMWRKRRLRLAEAAAYRAGLGAILNSDFVTLSTALAHVDVQVEGVNLSDAIRETAEETYASKLAVDDCERKARQALDILTRGRKNSYSEGLDALRDDTREWWETALSRDPNDPEEDQVPATADADGLRFFLETEALPWLANRKKELAYRPSIREQAFGEAHNPQKLEQIGRYEVHLDRKLERMLAMLFRLKEIRRETRSG